MKKIISFLIAAVIAINVNVAVAAESLNKTELVSINGYFCYEKDGQYWTMLDGDEYLIFNLDDYTMKDAGGSFSKNELSQYSTLNSNCPIGNPDGWYYCGYIDFSSGGSYTEGCYISSGDYDSKIYYTGPLAQTAKYIAKISTKQVLTNTYNVKIYIHNINQNKWETPVSSSLSFSILTPAHILVTGTTSQLYDGFALKFLQNSTGETPFYYTITVS